VLSDDKTKTLLDAERRLSDEDRDLARSFQLELGSPESQVKVGRTGRFAILAALVLSVVLLLVGFPSAAVACAVTTGLLWLMPKVSEEF
jgi:hypothetical protein